METSLILPVILIFIVLLGALYYQWKHISELNSETITGLIIKIILFGFAIAITGGTLVILIIAILTGQLSKPL